MRFFIAPLAAATLTACVSAPQPPQQSRAANTPIYCTHGQDCADKWRAAQAWVAQNSRFRLQIVTDAVISTYGPTMQGGASTHLAFQVTREPAGAGRDRIKVWAGCSNVFGCLPTTDEGTAAAKRAIAPEQITD